MFINSTSDNTYYVNPFHFSATRFDDSATPIAWTNFGQIATLVAVAEKHQATGLSRWVEIRNQ
jgi:hypothetical protein